MNRQEQTAVVPYVMGITEFFLIAIIITVANALLDKQLGTGESESLTALVSMAVVSVMRKVTIGAPLLARSTGVLLNDT